MNSFKTFLTKKWIIIGLVVGIFLMITFNQINKSEIITGQLEGTRESTQSSILSSKIEMGVVELNVANLELQKNFYEDLVGLEIISETDSVITLGYQSREVIRLIHTPDLSLFPRNSAGLYHIAILYESQATLAQVLAKILQTDPVRFEGSSDHLVSEAFYFNDPEGNGVELYFDRDPSTWQWDNGKVVMGSQYIDPQDYINAYSQVSAKPVKKMGHIHLQVGDISEAKKFYVDILGFSITSEMPSALFLSDGYYHHHIGMNVWNSEGSGKRNDTLGLKSFTILLSDIADIEALENRLNEVKINYEEIENGITVQDPWGTMITFSSD